MQTNNVKLEQQQLPLDGAPSCSALREAYDSTALGWNGITFERAVTIPHIKLGLERIAQAIHKARRAA